MMMAMAFLVGCTSCNAQSDSPETEPSGGNSSTTHALGALTPQKALEYMKTTSELVIVDVATAHEYAEEHFDGAINIHYSEMPERYDEIPRDRKVLLHCRLGMVVPNAYRVLLEKRPDIVELSYIDGAPLFEAYNSWKKEQENENGNDIVEGERYLGGLTPSDALEYMKTMSDLYIIDVREDEWYEGYTQFDGNMHIPRSQLPTRYIEIPSDRPVILNCGAGVQAPRAYEFLREKNADIKQLSYIAGTPLFSAYNNWLKEQNK